MGTLKDEIGSNWSILTIGIILIFFTSGHSYLHQKLSKTESEDLKNEMEEFKKRANDADKLSQDAIYDYNLLVHLIDVTNKLVNFKRAEFKKRRLSPKERFDYSVLTNLMMLCEFYEAHSKNTEFRIVYFIPSRGNKYLTPYLWYNHKQESPKSVGQPNNYPRYFSYKKSTTNVCESWRTRSIKITEDTRRERFTFYHPGQDLYLKSMIAYPILNPDNNKVTGIISVVSDAAGFFKKAEEDYHRFIIDHFATRINFENSELLRSVATEDNK